MWKCSNCPLTNYSSKTECSACFVEKVSDDHTGWMLIHGTSMPWDSLNINCSNAIRMVDESGDHLIVASNSHSKNPTTNGNGLCLWKYNVSKHCWNKVGQYNDLNVSHWDVANPVLLCDRISNQLLIKINSHDRYLSSQDTHLAKIDMNEWEHKSNVKLILIDHEDSHIALDNTTSTIHMLKKTICGNDRRKQQRLWLHTSCGIDGSHNRFIHTFDDIGIKKLVHLPQKRMLIMFGIRYQRISKNSCDVVSCVQVYDMASNEARWSTISKVDFPCQYWYKYSCAVTPNESYVIFINHLEKLVYCLNVNDMTWYKVSDKFICSPDHAMQFGVDSKNWNPKPSMIMAKYAHDYDGTCVVTQEPFCGANGQDQHAILLLVSGYLRKFCAVTHAPKDLLYEIGKFCVMHYIHLLLRKQETAILKSSDDSQTQCMGSPMRLTKTISHYKIAINSILRQCELLLCE